MEIQEKLNQLNEKSDALKFRVDTVLDSTQPTECSIAMSPELKNEIGNLIIEYMQLEQLCEKECCERLKTLNAVKTDYENSKTQKKQVTQPSHKNHELLYLYVNCTIGKDIVKSNVSHNNHQESHTN